MENFEKIKYQQKSLYAAELGANALQNPSLNAIATVQAYGIYSLQTYLNYLQDQNHPLTCSEENLDLWASRLNVDRNYGSIATGQVVMAGVSNNYSVPAGIQLIDFNNQIYLTEESPSGSTVNITATESGENFNLGGGNELTLGENVAGLLPSKITVSEENPIQGGSDIEATADWRERMVTALSSQRRLGTLEDYIFWAVSASPNITHAWANVYPYEGQITLTCMGENIEVAETFLDEVKNYVEEKKPAGVPIFVRSATTLNINLTIEGINTADQRNSIEELIQELINSKKDQFSEVTINELNSRILSVNENGNLISPLTTIKTNAVQKMKLNNIIWQ